MTTTALTNLNGHPLWDVTFRTSPRGSVLTWQRYAHSAEAAEAGVRDYARSTWAKAEIVSSRKATA